MRTRGWNIDVQYRHYLQVVDKYESTHNINKIHKYSKREFRQKINFLKNELGMKRINYKKDIVERQVFTELSKKAAKTIQKRLSNDKSLKNKAMSRWSIEKWGQKGAHNLTKDQADLLSDVLSEQYWNYKESGMSSNEAKKAISHFYFGSPS